MNAKQSLLASALAAIGASACCVLPLLLLMLGIGGAWVAQLTKLEPLRPIFVLITLIFLALAWRKLYRAPQACAADQPVPTTRSSPASARCFGSPYCRLARSWFSLGLPRISIRR